MKTGIGIVQQILDALPVAAWCEEAAGKKIHNAAAGKLDARFWRQDSEARAKIEAHELDSETRYRVGLGGEPGYVVYRKSVELEPELPLVLSVALADHSRELQPITDPGEPPRSQRLETLGRLAAGLAHDFNNILTTAIGNLDLIDRSELGPQASDATAAVAEALEAARRLNTQLVTFPDPPHARWPRKAAAELVHDAARFALRGANVGVRLAEASTDAEVSLDPAQLAQVITNLVLNAAEAMADGGVIELRVSDSPGTDEVTISVVDFGHGIPRSLTEQVFQPYFTTTAGHSGLGLPVVKSIVEEAGGSISVDSRPGRGTSVMIRLPKRVAVAEANTHPRSLRERLRILVMDDEHPVRDTIIRMAERLGCAAIGAQDGVEAVYLYESALEHRNRFDLVVLDLTVPGAMGGREALARLKRLDRNVRALVTSGYIYDPVMSDPTAHGFVGALQKPCTLDELTEALACSIETPA